MDNLLELKWMIPPLLACLVLSINHVYLGIHVISRKVIFVDLALAQIAALGATYATTLGYDPFGDSLKVSLFSLAFTFVGAGAFAIARMRKERVPQEAFIGIIYAAASAAAILILSKSATGGEELKHMLVGDLLLVSLSSVVQMAILYGAIGLFHILFRKKFLAISADPEAAEAAGINVRFWDVLFYMSFGVVITKSVAIVGVLLVFSYLVVPAVIAQMWSSTIRGRLLLGWLVAIIASLLGIVWSFYKDYPTGPAVVVMLAIFLIVSSVLYYVLNTPKKARAILNIAFMFLLGFSFVAGLSLFKKQVTSSTTKLAPVDIMLNELNEGDEAHRLDAVKHLGEMHDPRIVPALVQAMENTTSEGLIESIVEALSQQRDPRAIPALQSAAKRDYDPFLKLTIARGQLAVGDNQGFQTLIEILKNEEAGYARVQANELLEQLSAQKFGFQPEKSAAENKSAITEIETWWKDKGSKLKYGTGKWVL
ncbi:MAG TPA: iron chelate uptake ABC transporter family permease subunit [Acidobacteriota bacterium]|nr:iron chelate uptake ABC transporter family permease subunit [Acidobacteriota bacterium]